MSMIEQFKLYFSINPIVVEYSQQAHPKHPLGCAAWQEQKSDFYELVDDCELARVAIKAVCNQSPKMLIAIRPINIFLNLPKQSQYIISSEYGLVFTGFTKQKQPLSFLFSVNRPTQDSINVISASLVVVLCNHIIQLQLLLLLAHNICLSS